MPILVKQLQVPENGYIYRVLAVQTVSLSGDMDHLQTELKQVCPVCKMPPSGSMTSWIFQKNYCRCKKEPHVALSQKSTQKPHGASTLQAGELLDGKYRVVRLIGHGGMGTIYEGVHVGLGKRVAIKFFDSMKATHPKAFERFHMEAKAASRLNHPSLVAVTDYGVSQSNHTYLIMDLVEGESLAEYIEKQGQLRYDETIYILQRLSDALGYAHRQGIVHRDLKPGNIMLSQVDDQDLNVQIIDFGVAKMLIEDEQEGNALTETGEIFGSPFYMSPEQCVGKKVGPQSDLYSLGCVIYECLVGRPPFMAENILMTISMHLQDQATRISSYRPDVPPLLEAIISKLLKKELNARYRNAEELKADLAILQAEQAGQSLTMASRLRACLLRSGAIAGNGKVRTILICSALFFVFVVSGSFLLRLSPDAVRGLFQPGSKQSQVQQAEPLVSSQSTRESVLSLLKEEEALRNELHKWQHMRGELFKEHDFGTRYLHAAEQVLALTQRIAAIRRSLFGEQARQNKLSNQQNADNRNIAAALVDLSHAEVFNDALPSAQKHLIEGIALLGDNNLHGTNSAYNWYRLHANSDLAYCFARQGRYAEAITAASQALETTSTDRNKVFVLLIRAKAYAHLNENALALADYRKAFDTVDTNVQKAQISDEMGYLETQKTGDGSSSIEDRLTKCREFLADTRYEKYNEQLLAESQKMLQLTLDAKRSPKEIAVAYCYLGVAQSTINDDQSAITSFEQALKKFNSDCRADDVKYWLPATQYSLARSYYKQGKYKESYKYASDALAVSVTSQDKALILSLQSSAKSKLQHTLSSEIKR